ncbi:hypothetical protein SETIT_9G529200v2 [Setaria italica]|uniref:Uncharacterized protein n=1 Tax=Setaria italica TaxID=4555 RepID=A0A368SVI0_SETIT|nr:hypothetical protein SETIT_9G529200v2 [Setaria italica]
MLHRRSIENLLNLSVPYLVRETTQSMVMPELQLWPPDFTTTPPPAPSSAAPAGSCRATRPQPNAASSNPLAGAPPHPRRRPLPLNSHLLLPQASPLPTATSTAPVGGEQARRRVARPPTTAAPSGPPFLIRRRSSRPPPTTAHRMASPARPAALPRRLASAAGQPATSAPRRPPLLRPVGIGAPRNPQTLTLRSPDLDAAGRSRPPPTLRPRAPEERWTAAAREDKQKLGRAGRR